MPIVTFWPQEKSLRAEPNTPLYEVANRLGISVEMPCGGNGVCGKCLVKITSGTVDFENNGILPQNLMDDGFVLICKTKVKDEDVWVEVFSDLENEEGSFTKIAEDTLLIDKALMPTKEELSPLAKKVFLKVEEPLAGDGLSDYDRFEKAVSSLHLAKYMDLPLSILKTLPLILRENSHYVTVSYLIKNETVHIVNIESEDTTMVGYGIAVDIGTTTIAVQLINTADGTIFSSKTDYNMQIECGLDVISRINYAKNPQRQKELQNKVISAINVIIEDLCKVNRINQNCIINASLAGNTTMVQLLLGIFPEYLRLDPYVPPVYDVPLYKASEIGLYMNENAFIYLAPSVGSYVGGDITSGLLATSLSTESEALSLFIDIGTNGELVIGSGDFLMCCACSAGPAFEGGGIENGMRASKGAIERVMIDKETGVAQCFTIGEGSPIGICGSGMISLIASLFETGWIDAAGKLNRTKISPAIEIVGKQAKYILSPQDGENKAIYITEADIDNLIRAKGAIFSACRVMLNNIEMSFDDLEKIYIAGGFGRYLNIENAITIGLLPNIPIEKFKYIGNSSIIGASMTLLSQKHREKQHEIANKLTYIDLSTESKYMDEYTAALFLPHTDLKYWKPN